MKNMILAILALTLAAAVPCAAQTITTTLPSGTVITGDSTANAEWVDHLYLSGFGQAFEEMEAKVQSGGSGDGRLTQKALGVFVHRRYQKVLEGAIFAKFMKAHDGDSTAVAADPDYQTALKRVKSNYAQAAADAFIAELGDLLDGGAPTATTVAGAAPALAPAVAAATVVDTTFADAATAPDVQAMVDAAVNGKLGTLNGRLSAVEQSLQDTRTALFNGLTAVEMYAMNGKRKELAQALGPILDSIK